MPTVFLSPSTQGFNPYIIGGNEKEYMNLLADSMEPYLRASGIDFVRNDPSRGAAGAIADSNAGNYDVHLALHSNAAPDRLSGQLRGIDVYYAPYDSQSERLARIIANNFMQIYPLPDRSRAVPATNLGEVLRTRAVANLVEIGYHDNFEDATWLTNNLSSIAKNLVISLTDYFGIPFIEPGETRTGVVVTDGSNLNLRSYPSTSGAILGSIPNGTNLVIQGETNGWYIVNYNGRTGYSSSEFIELT
ncbi:MAG: SH3 domain-containing protein [Clostridiales bacterium]|nr:SH3 domain-containing protein [Clostridiales bacterium]